MDGGPPACDRLRNAPTDRRDDRADMAEKVGRVGRPVSREPGLYRSWS